MIYQADLTAGHEYPIVVEFSKEPDVMLSALRLGVLPPLPADQMERAAALAAQADVALVFAGLSSEWESEGFDRADLELPGRSERTHRAGGGGQPQHGGRAQRRLGGRDALAGAGRGGRPGRVSRPGGGQCHCRRAVRRCEPSGKLPQTFPVRLEDTPAYLNFPGENGQVLYGERLFVGYRYYDKKRIAPLFPFGFGLSYTTFAYDNLRLSASAIGPGDTLQVAIDVTNTGERAGQEVVQVYVRDVAARLQRPEKELKAFAKVMLQPGERQTVTLPLTRESLAYFDDRAHEWVAEAGTFEVLVGASAQDIRATATFELTETEGWLV